MCAAPAGCAGCTGGLGRVGEGGEVVRDPGPHRGVQGCGEELDEPEPVGGQAGDELAQLTRGDVCMLGQWRGPPGQDPVPGGVHGGVVDGFEHQQQLGPGRAVGRDLGVGGQTLSITGPFGGFARGLGESGLPLFGEVLVQRLQHDLAGAEVIQQPAFGHARGLGHGLEGHRGDPAGLDHPQGRIEDLGPLAGTHSLCLHSRPVSGCPRRPATESPARGGAATVR